MPRTAARVQNSSASADHIVVNLRSAPISKVALRVMCSYSLISRSTQSSLLAFSGIHTHTADMFKRIEKRIRKKEKEEELGLDEDTKEMLGMNDTDSDESSSSEDSSDEEGKEIRDDMDENASDEDDVSEMEEGVEEHTSESDPDSDDVDEEPPMSLSEALQNPIYLVCELPEVKACVVCPGKLLKNPVMIDIHLKSNVSALSLRVSCEYQPKASSRAQAHSRRFSRLRETAMDVDADSDVRDLVRAQFAPPEEKRPEGKLSKRAEKKVR